MYTNWIKGYNTLFPIDHVSLSHGTLQATVNQIIE